ncbi:hypothetical protein A3E45_02255 [Candidatus Daviesbacteria bacterium RIFCSPHIGHO2_12_FULL_43_11]|uniref:Uncharacterized protein n=1 Tax=Candidatus Daviesbacteria bacterium RIFCSPHIGHO2_12_FULL_43_11 TaxID=1797780 RepID=A0A1F5K0H9_9BACT|nr:MAG: hypothetical protein A3E45_02255 [Candidatus Daviesbacteria bacterium RIFCSPHIGHO2_12_FULL_43_11]
METQGRTEKRPGERVIPLSEGVGLDIQPSDLQRVKEKLKTRLSEAIREAGDSEDAIGIIMEVIDGMVEPDNKAPVRNTELSAEEKLAKFAKINNEALELRSTKVKYFLGSSMTEGKPNFDEPIIEQLDPEDFDVSLIRVALGERQNLLDMTHSQIAEAAEAEAQSHHYPAFHIADTYDGGFRLRVRTIVAGINFRLEAGLLGGGSIVNAELS